MNANVSHRFIKEKDLSTKANFGDDREQDITGKPQFNDMAVHGITLDDITLVSSNLRKGVRDAAGGNKAQKEALKTLVKAWNKAMKKLANYVTIKALEKNVIDEQIAIINLSGFGCIKMTKTLGTRAGQVTGFKMLPLPGFAGMAEIYSNPLGRNTTYSSIFSRQPEALDAIVILNEQIMLPDTDTLFIMHFTTTSKRQKVILTSGEKWYGIRFAVNRTGRGSSSEKASAIPQ